MKIGKISGISIEIHPTWLIIFFLITVSMVAEFKGEFPDRSGLAHQIAGMSATILFFISVLIHEFSHSLLAIRMGHKVRSITLFVFGGISEIEEEAHKPSAEFWIAIVGPFSSLVLSALFLVSSNVISDSTKIFASVFSKLAKINFALALFNLVPAFPLDGGRVLRSAIWKFTGNLHKATVAAARAGKVFAYILILFGVLMAFGKGPLMNGLWIIFIGWFLMNAADSSVRQLQVQQALDGLKARDILTAECPEINSSETLKELVETHILPTGNRCFLVTDNSQLSGLISMHEIKKVPRDRWTNTSVGDVMKKAEDLRVVTPDTDVLKILKAMDDEKFNQLPVVEKDQVVGVVTREKLLNMIRTRLALMS